MKKVLSLLIVFLFACTTNAKVTAMESVIERAVPANHSIIWMYVNFPVGYEFTENNKQYRLMLFSFIEYSTGDKYNLKVPMRFGDGEGYGIYTEHDTTPLTGVITTVGNVSYSVFNIKESRSYYANPMPTIYAGYVNNRLDFDLKFKVGETVITIESYNDYFGSQEVIGSIIVDQTSTDFSDMGMPTIADTNDLHDMLNHFISHIQITKVP